MRNPNSNLRVHILCNPIIPTDPKLTADGFNQIAMLTTKELYYKGHTVFFYGNGGPEINFDLPCTEYINVLNLDNYIEVIDRLGSYEGFNDGKYLSWMTDDLGPHAQTVCRKYNYGCQKLIKDIIQKDDLVLLFWDYSTAVKELCDMVYENGGIPVSAWDGSGSIGKWVMPFRYYISSSYHCMVNRRQCMENRDIDRSMWHVIPFPIDIEEFDYEAVPNKVLDPKGPFLFLGRIQVCKGACIFTELAKSNPDKTFWMAGYGKQIGNTLVVDGYKDDETGKYKKHYINLDEIPNLKYWGFADRELRKQLLSQATALIQPTNYPEPFGLNVIEAYASGTPVITSKKGAFNETVQQNVTGYRCWDEDEFKFALEDVAGLSPIECLGFFNKYDKNRIIDLYIQQLQRIVAHQEETGDHYLLYEVE